MRVRALIVLPTAVIDSRKRRNAPRDGTADAGETGSASLFEEGKVRAQKGKGPSAKSNNPNKLTAAQLRELEAQKEREASQSWHRVQDLWPRMLANDVEAVREWLVEAEKLVESFRETRALFLTSRVRVPPVIVDDYAQLWLVAPWV